MHRQGNQNERLGVVLESLERAGQNSCMALQTQQTGAASTISVRKR
jgi:hypothetical protein